MTHKKITKQGQSSYELARIQQLVQQNTSPEEMSPKLWQQIKQWLRTRKEAVAALLSPMFRARLSRSEWLALAMAAGLTVSSLTYPLLAQSRGLAQAGSEFQVNTMTSGSQLQIEIAMDADGNFVIVWASANLDGSSFGIAAQQYDRNTVPQGDEFRVNTYVTSSQDNPDVAMDANGNFVVVWESYFQDGSGEGIYAQRYNASGDPQGSEFRVNPQVFQSDPSVAMDSSGDFVVAWRGTGGITFQRFDNGGTPLGDGVVVGSGNDPNVAMDSSGDFVVTWEYKDPATANIDIFARRYNANGEAQGDEFQVNTYTSGNQHDPKVALDSDGDFVVAWTSGDSYQAAYGPDENQDGSLEGVYAQRYSSNGTPAGNEFQVNTYTTHRQGDFFLGPGLAMDNDGDFVITWESESQDGDGTGIYAQQYNANGTPDGSEFQINIYTTRDQGAPSVAMLKDGEFVVSWHSIDQDGDSFGVFARKYGPIAAVSEMQVWGFSLEIPDGDTSPDQHEKRTSFEVGNVGDLRRTTYTINNLGSGALTIGSVTIGGESPDYFSVYEAPPSSIPPFSSGTFTIQFQPQDTDYHRAEVIINNNDSNENPYNFAVAGYALEHLFAEINVEGNGQEISHEDDSPSFNDHTKFGDILLEGGTKTRTYTIRNTGNTLSHLGDVMISGPHADDFTVSQQYTSNFILDNDEPRVFKIRFNPSGLGKRTAVVSFTNSDDDEDPYTFTVEGRGVPNPKPEIVVSGNGMEIVDGDVTPDINDHTDFGEQEIGTGPVGQTFIIANTGDAELTISKVTLENSSRDDFIILQQPNSPVAVGESTTFQIWYTPTVTVTRIADVVIDNDDEDENPYNFRVQGKGYLVEEAEEETGSDGVSDETEDGAPNNGDGDDDGLPDREQDNVTSLPGKSGKYLTLKSTAGTTLTNVAVMSQTTVAPPPGTTFAEGIVDFTLEGVTPGETVTVVLTVHSGQKPRRYLKLQDGAWVEYDGATIKGKQVILTLTDGGMGDDDGVVNGVIVDPGGVDFGTLNSIYLPFIIKGG